MTIDLVPLEALLRVLVQELQCVLRHFEVLVRSTREWIAFILRLYKYLPQVFGELLGAHWQRFCFLVFDYFVFITWVYSSHDFSGEDLVSLVRVKDCLDVPFSYQDENAH